MRARVRSGADNACAETPRRSHYARSRLRHGPEGGRTCVFHEEEDSPVHAVHFPFFFVFNSSYDLSRATGGIKFKSGA